MFAVIQPAPAGICAASWCARDSFRYISCGPPLPNLGGSRIGPRRSSLRDWVFVGRWNIICKTLGRAGNRLLLKELAKSGGAEFSWEERAAVTGE
jgi:hypothetical protein